ncbi:APC family permease [Paraburkholderia hospita]|jgi:amino acid transporter|uniref:APC family permease n=1 Tax=Paraburkholderia hospita TaxID=169430 RepID=A0AAN1ML10_9BURK|nr:APC family permease [Paraburkholderia hospita]SOE85580.1 amino acid/polyamine/organocation transporter, APC superfamily [Burkholderia sp. YR290]AUT70991.1 APC family permease [Paraburkholderia hospita]EIM98333.1 amino acid permease [Paraburkholderia hospita]OUL71066.1 amino acid permease [Paraburkholderia hospita]OUL86095.1 amino acid permease [Paraburkholderia hospita]
MSAVSEDYAAETADGTLHRKISWTGAFWVASGVPALVLFSIGSIAATVGKLSWAVWIVSIGLGFIQSFSYAEIAGLFPHKSGGASVYGAIAWVRYSKLFAPLSVWCNWFAWSPVLAIGSGLAAGYILSVLFPADAAINTWQITLVSLDWLRSGLSLRINSTFILGAVVLLITFAIQHRGILNAARIQTILGIAALVPLILVGTVPLISGDLPLHNLLPLVPFAKDSAGQIVDGSWNRAGITLMAGGLFIAAWSTYGFETAVCYTREFRNPKVDTFKAILYSGLLCIFVFTIVPLAFQGVLGLGHLVTPAVKDAAGNIVTPAIYDGMLSPDIYSGMGVAKAMAPMIHGGLLVERVLIVMLVLALVLAIMTSMAGSSRTLYQASVDGWLPKYLSHVNEHGAPTRAMWTDLCFNLVLLLMSDYVFVLAMSNVGYIIFNFLNLNSAWIHRLDRPDWSRPFRAPNWLLALGTLFSFVNLALLGMGADIWGAGTLVSGLCFAALIVPVFLFRHYVTDKGHFPEAMKEDMQLVGSQRVARRAGILPYVTVAAGIVVIVVTHSLAIY